IFSRIKSPSHPKVIARTIMKAISTQNPKTRYVAGSGAKPLLFLRSIISDKCYDRIMRKMV
ncbi:MAG TPA: hypothetical protein P5243_06605, partial [Bacteroidales bacterium]|nr:hypothetical protein [Bacteroidales bacterium]